MTEDPQYMSELRAELARAGVRGTRRERILAEFADHLACDPAADLGDAGSLASQFADELGTSFARTAAFRAFLALALAGLLVGVRFLAILPLASANLDAGDTVTLLITALAGQVALVAGGLGLLRALQLRAREVVPRAEAVVLARRAGVGLAAGALTILAMSITHSAPAHAGAASIGHQGTNVWWPISSAFGLAVLLAAIPTLVQAARLRPQVKGQATDVLADLGPLQPAAVRLSGGSVTRLALILGASLVTASAIAGFAADDPYDGILRGLLESGAFLAAYTLLGRYLGLRH